MLRNDSLPARAQGGDVQGGPQPLPVVPGQVEQRVDLGHAQRVRARAGPDDLVAGADVTFGQDAQVEPGRWWATSSDGSCGSPIRIPTRKQVTRGWVTSNSASPIR